MRYWSGKPEGMPGWFRWLFAGLLLLPSAIMATEIRHADHIWQDHDRLLVRVYLDVDLPEVLVEALANGVGVTLRSEVRLVRTRGILGEHPVKEAENSVQIRYYALSRHYMVTDLERDRIELAPTLGDALELLAKRLGRVVLEIDRDRLRSDHDYMFGARVKLNHTALPLPLQWDARLRGAYVTQLGWYRWPLQQ